MPKLPNLPGHELVKILVDFGFVKKRQKGSHVLLIKETKDEKIGCVVPLHKELAKGTLIGILKQAKIDRDEFLKNIKK